ncbi:hypothetical protein EYF80_047304 [Liparis tanakae]|uniref:Uncharacterized protein n=1 Tax=Liparis tanakae TaxID=230148 RepID=A0A4Z2FMZ9_9TELE|nr:hypothetical protein EYF80_047304 [Liparis tanakae]
MGSSSSVSSSSVSRASFASSSSGSPRLWVGATAGAAVEEAGAFRSMGVEPRGPSQVSEARLQTAPVGQQCSWSSQQTAFLKRGDKKCLSARGAIGTIVGGVARNVPHPRFLSGGRGDLLDPRHRAVLVVTALHRQSALILAGNLAHMGVSFLVDVDVHLWWWTSHVAPSGQQCVLSSQHTACRGNGASPGQHAHVPSAVSQQVDSSGHSDAASPHSTVLTRSAATETFRKERLSALHWWASGQQCFPSEHGTPCGGQENSAGHRDPSGHTLSSSSPRNALIILKDCRGHDWLSIRLALTRCVFTMKATGVKHKAHGPNAAH